MLAKSTGGMTVVETISMWLTILCGVCYIGYFVFFVVKDMLEEGLDCVSLLYSTPSVGSVLLYLTPSVGSVVFQSYILITEVLLSNDDDAPLSGGLEIAAFVVYGITALIIGGFTALVFSGFE